MNRSRPLVLAVFLLAWALVCAPRLLSSPSFRLQADGAILGHVVDGVTGRPIAGARVARPGNPEWTLTTRDGEFVFLGITPGTYRLIAMKAGYVSAEFGEGMPTAAAAGAAPWEETELARVVTVPQRTIDEPVIRLWKYGVISGRILDEYGEPVVGVQVHAWPKIFAGGRGRLSPAMPFTGESDDRGHYRISSLLPGRYVVLVPAISITMGVGDSVDRTQPSNWSADLFRIQRLFHPPEASPGGASPTWMTSTIGHTPVSSANGDQVTAYIPTFHPSTDEPTESEELVVRSGEELSGIDVQLRAAPVRRVSGRVTSLPQGVRATITATMSRFDEADSGAESALVASDANGRFEFPALPEGQYRLRVFEITTTGRRNTYSPRNAADGVVVTEYAVDPRSEAPTLWADIPLTVGRSDLTDVVVNLQTGVRVSGTVAFVGSTRPPPFGERLSLVMDRADAPMRGAKPSNEIVVETSGRFRSVEMIPGTYFLRAGLVPAGWWLRSVTYRGNDISVVPLEIGRDAVADVVVTLSDRPSELSGMVKVGEGVRAADVSVVVFPADPTTWERFGARPRSIVRRRPGLDGGYNLVNLPAGDYYVRAVDDVALAEWPDRGTLLMLSARAERIRLADGERRTLDLVAQAATR